MTVGRVID